MEGEHGLFVVFTGDGMGKTSAALGIALRACGHGLNVCIIQFIKGDTYSGEHDAIKKLAPNVELYVMGIGFCNIPGDTHSFEEHRQSAQAGLALAEQRIDSGAFNVLILDEINNALSLGLVDLSQVLKLIDRKSPSLHLIFTGRDAHEEIIRRADTVTEMREIKHAFQQGIGAQKGIDY
jgi:cob(I)alamin adenosyltransferase